MKQLNKKKLLDIENIRKKFIKQFSVENIKKMNIDDYILGKANKNTFCHLLEYGLKDLGEIRGSRSDKYKVYFGKTKKEKKKEYRYTKEYNNADEAFDNAKELLVELIECGIKDNDENAIKRLKNNKFCPTVKGKILYIYYPDKYLPIYSKKDLILIIKSLNIDTNSIELQTLDEFDLRVILLNWKKNNNEFQNKSMIEFTTYLYDKYKNYFFEKKIDNNLLNEINDYGPVKIDINKIKIEPTKKVKLKKIDGFEFYPRNIKIAVEALARADYKCEYCNEHECFIRKKDGKPYTEVHHLIPLAYFKLYNDSLDNIANIVSLCSNCHNEIHYGKNADIIIKKLYELRKDELREANLSIELNELLDMYK